MLKEIYIECYRSIRELNLELTRLNVITGHNGSGKSNTYQALQLIQDAARGSFAERVVQEGGIPSLMWAGSSSLKRYNSRRNIELILSIRDEESIYELRAGVPIPVPGSMFLLDPEIKEEKIWLGDKKRPSALLVERISSTLISYNPKKEVTPLVLDTSESLLSQLRSPDHHPELFVWLNKILSWRFYHHFDVSKNSLIRQPHPCSRATILNNDGSNLIAAIRTIYEIGDEVLFKKYIANAFNGALIEITDPTMSSVFDLEFHQDGLYRPLSIRELSDGTLKFICLLTALLSPRPASVYILNEPEISLHMDLVDVLADLIVQVSDYSQIILITHSSKLKDKVMFYVDDASLIELEFGKFGTAVAIDL
ncbi:MAG: AAA family ATPase [Burkholderiales bacterium]|nr:AAA family ATPase [Burkholderiales bacterium]